MNSETNVMNSKKMILKVIFILLFFLLLIAGGTYAYWTWYSTVNKDVVFSTADVEDYIVYDEGNSSFVGNFLPVNNFCDSVSTTLSFYKRSNAPNMMKFTASIKMDVNSIGTNIAQSNDIYWIVTFGDNTINCTNGLSSTGVVAYGTFNGVSAGETIDLVNDIEVTFDEQKYTVWIWIDSSGSNLSDLSKETIDTNVWSLISMEEKTNEINFNLQGGTFDNLSYTTSGEHTYVAPYDGTYKLEVWGASGGSGVNNYTPGYGGYSVGNIELEQDTNIFINVGGVGSNAANNNTLTGGGYNGGGNVRYRAGGGGGATHIALVSGTLSSLSATNNINDILIVAGGGGGAGYNNANLKGGSGGGITGVDGGDSSTSNIGGGHGGTQSAGGSLGSTTSTAGTTGAFGTGGQGGYSSSNGSGGGGGGFYGGAGGSGNRGGGGGGSGYIGNSLLTDKAMYCYNCTTDSNASTLTNSVGQFYADATSNYAKSGDGAAKITLLDVNKIVKLGATYGTLVVPEKENQFFVGWNTKSDGTGVFVNSNSVYDENSGDTLYAIWASLPEYVVSYDANGGSGAPSAQTKTYGVDLTLSSTKPTRDEYVFLGWSASSTATSATYSAGGVYTENAAITLYAVWMYKTSITPINSYSCANGSAGSSPYDLVYTGNCTVIDDGNDNWRVKFLTTGTLTVSTDTPIDVFMVGGGGGGADSGHDYLDYRSDYEGGGGGGGGGFTLTSFANIKGAQPYSLVIGTGGTEGNNGGSTTGFGAIAYGGYSGNVHGGGTGGSGGGSGGYYEEGYSKKGTNGGSDGSAGVTDESNGGSGQGLTTREFGESTGDVYAGGGGGGGGYMDGGYSSAGSGGTNGGGAGGNPSRTSTSTGGNGTANTGGGGGGGARGYSGGTGGSGIIVIRNARNDSSNLPSMGFDFTYTGYYAIVNEGVGNWKIRFLTDGTFRTTSVLSVDAFLVGGGGAGSRSGYWDGGDYGEGVDGGGGGGGGKTTTSSVSIVANTDYYIDVGAGGSAGSNPTNGYDTTAFGLTAGKGSKGSGAGGAGGSGGGGGSYVADDGTYGNGGKGGSYGGNGSRGGSSSSPNTGGSGQRSTTCEFGEGTTSSCTNGVAFAYGGGGGGGSAMYTTDDGWEYLEGGAGGSGGGGQGGTYGPGAIAVPNTGGGGGGGGGGMLDEFNGGAGGSGIVIIRNAR